MKKSTFNIAKKLGIAIAFIAMTAATTSCENAFDQAVSNAAQSIGDSYDFNEAVSCIKNNSSWNRSEGCYEKFQGSIADATSTLRRYTNAKMEIPGSWYLDSDNYIIVRRSSNCNDIYDIEIRCSTYDAKGNRSGHDHFYAFFMYDRH